MGWVALFTPFVYNNPNITVHFNTKTLDIVSNTTGQMSGILVRKVDTRDESVLEAKGLFYGIGSLHAPKCAALAFQNGLITHLGNETPSVRLLKEVLQRTNGQDRFIYDHERRQAITAAGLGCIAALSVERYLASNNLLVEFHQTVGTSS
ncbi:hypothetical protein CsSME_00033191 [Camellia sinensis var. sinensis]